MNLNTNVTTYVACILLGATVCNNVRVILYLRCNGFNINVLVCCLGEL
jgi:hypothetical protein